MLVQFARDHLIDLVAYEFKVLLHKLKSICRKDCKLTKSIRHRTSYIELYFKYMFADTFLITFYIKFTCSLFLDIFAILNFIII